MSEFSIKVFESYTNSWIVELRNSDDKLLAWANESEIKTGMVQVVDKFIEKFPEHRKAVLEAMFDEIDNSKDCKQCNLKVGVEE